MTLGAAADPGVNSTPAAADRAAARLAAVLGTRLLGLETEAGPDRGLSDLIDQAKAGTEPWLAALAQDVGAPLAEGGCWTQALGAWRQATLLLIPAEQLASGLPAAGCALLRQWQVPLVGLLQWGGAWQPQQRLRDGLPWLGLLPRSDGADGQPGGDTDELALAAALTLRLRRLQDC